jgi:hypothetical protein
MEFHPCNLKVEWISFLPFCSPSDCYLPYCQNPMLGTVTEIQVW